MITAIVLIHTDPHSIPETAQAVADLPGVSEVYSCAGDIDLIAILRVGDHEQIAHVVTERITKIPGVRSSSTQIAFKQYASSDVEAAFSLGD
ncbi:Lrp/AsnC ligand binding domain-containing protein [Hoyosella sp. G463]|uniref:Lrp/AsnC ligand binding domain-containing protein n=1 Tax=Lolliginicoccus lacisalsi TaxID=2742202 RepID=A0A927PM97_9ACTN|nr:Lrp/AsnC ligand binding domain-containing protein [Lolliginicoccus lacisalsi]MBD8507723.1 Lrp/AsnC ligand binding domain-containing protein [Lolliginicoccus lacisalsi]